MSTEASEKVRVRFAPSPTGYLHIGGVRTALFNWLFARHNQGTFILRIEDTDRSRSTEESIKIIEDGLKWLGLDWDEGPVRQMDRLEIYKEYTDKLLADGKAYRCYCTKDELDQRRKEAQAKKLPPGYDGRCRDRTGSPPDGPSAIRFRASKAGQTVVEDIVKGNISFDNSQVDDLIMVRSDGVPTYNFGVVVDDSLMNVTHVIRGDDHVNNTPRQIQIYHALGLPIPKYAHLSMILGSDKARLSKRHGATSITEYRDQGYLPEALINYLVRLGWSHGDQEIFSLDELIENFSLEKVVSSAAVFNPEKLLWLNGQYIHKGANSRLAELLVPFLVKEGLEPEQLDSRVLGQVIGALKERSRTLIEMAQGAAYFFKDEVVFDEKARAKFLKPENRGHLENLAKRLEAVSSFSHGNLEKIFNDLMEETGLKLGKLAQPVRVALTGRTVSPGIFDVIEILGKDRTVTRLKKAIDMIP
ncbi:MAG TPA: glutamate--tRNA ligase, partial [Nitrospiria bacterium]|nr:glutamate--tRNA ligase [Nitrospiria bacterium]